MCFSATETLSARESYKIATSNTRFSMLCGSTAARCLLVDVAANFECFLFHAQHTEIGS